MNSEGNEYQDLLVEYAELIEIEDKKFNEDDLVCECFLISIGDIKALVKNNDTKIENLPKWCFDNTCLGHACGSCMKTQDNWKHEI